MPLVDRITSDPEICHGRPVVRGSRYPVETLLRMLASGMSVDEIVGDHADLEREDVLAALAYGASVVGRHATTTGGSGTLPHREP